MNYPPLPEPYDGMIDISGSGEMLDGFTADQMHAYVDLDRKARATAEPVAWLWTDRTHVQAFTTKPPPSMLRDPRCEPLFRAPAASAEPMTQSIQSLLDDAILAQGQIGRLQTIIREHEETIRQLVRAHREATEGKTFMGEPVLPVRAPAASVAPPIAWVCTDYDGHADVGMTKEQAKERAGEHCTEFFGLVRASNEWSKS